MAASPSSIYVASAESDIGKTTIALGLLHLLAASAARVGEFQPIVRSTDEAISSSNSCSNTPPPRSTAMPSAWA